MVTMTPQKSTLNPRIERSLFMKCVAHAAVPNVEDTDRAGGGSKILESITSMYSYGDGELPTENL